MMINNIQIASLLGNQPPSNDDDPFDVIPRPDIERLKAKPSAAIDLRLGCWFATLRKSKSSLLDIREKSNLLEENAFTKMQYIPFRQKFVLHPRDFVLGVTLEWIRMSNKYGGYVTSRSKWGRRGLVIATAIGVHPSFIGCLTLELTNLGEVPIALYPGMQVCQLFLHKVDGAYVAGNDSAYAGKRKPFIGQISLEDDPIAMKLIQDADGQ